MVDKSDILDFMGLGDDAAKQEAEAHEAIGKAALSLFAAFSLAGRRASEAKGVRRPPEHVATHAFLDAEAMLDEFNRRTGAEKP